MRTPGREGPMMRIRTRASREDGGVLIVVAIVFPVLIALVAGGVVGFTLFTAQRETQMAADQAAVAGAAALPPLNPNAVYENLPFPLPDTDPLYQVFEEQELNIPRVGELIPDPRSVACVYGSLGLASESAALVGAFGAPFGGAPTDVDGAPLDATVCNDDRVYPSMQSSTVIDCIDQITDRLSAEITARLIGDPLLAPLLPDILGAVVARTEQLVDGLNEAVPAAMSPRMRVDVTTGFRPPMLSIIVGGEGLTLRASAVAVRRLKNAVVVPVLPGQQVGPVVTDPVNLNDALREAQPPLVALLGTMDGQLNTMMSTLGLSCRDVLSDLQRDLSDIYNPPSGPAPSAVDIVEEAVTAAQDAAARTGIPVDELAGEAFYFIGAGDSVTVGSIVSGVVGPLLDPIAQDLLGPIAALQIPTLDVAIVALSEVSDGDYRAALISAANAYGAFRATLVR